MMRRARRPWYPDQLFWWVRLSAWSLAALPLAITAFALNLISPWLIGAGPVLFEVGFAVLEWRRRLAMERRNHDGGGNGGEPDVVREPRILPPFEAAGAVALPIPTEDAG